MNNQEYWENRAIVKDKLLEKDINKTEKKLLKLFENVKEELLKELRVIYSDPQAFTPYQISNIDELLESVYKAIDNLYKNNEKQVTEALVDTYKTMYNEASVDLKASFNTVNEDLIREVVKTNWSGLTFSDRIWEHRGKLKVALKEELSKGLIRGDSLQDISRLMTDRLNNSYSNAIRLVRTESCWIMNEATVNNYKNNGIKEYEFMAFLDKKTSPQCRELDGKRLYIDEARAGLNLPPLHPNCRSCIIPITEKVVIDKPKEVDTVKVLEDKGVKIDIDSFKDIDKRLFKENIEQLNKLIDKYPKIQEYIKEYPLTFKAEDMKAQTNAYCGSNFNKDVMIIAINNKNYYDYDSLIERAKHSMASGWHCEALLDSLSSKTLTHEFGHMIHNVMIANYGKDNKEEKDEYFQKAMKANTLEQSRKRLRRYDEMLVKKYNKEIIKIAKGIDPNVNTKISEYGSSSAYEFFAECFANYECGKPNTLGKAMGMFLERNFK